MCCSRRGQCERSCAQLIPVYLLKVVSWTLMDGFGPRAQTGLTIVLYLLSQKFLPLGYEQNVMASQMLMNFQRHSGESIDAARSCYDTVQCKAALEANLDLGPAGTT